MSSASNLFYVSDVKLDKTDKLEIITDGIIYHCNYLNQTTFLFDRLQYFLQIQTKQGSRITNTAMPNTIAAHRGITPIVSGGAFLTLVSAITSMPSSLTTDILKQVVSTSW